MLNKKIEFCDFTAYNALVFEIKKLRETIKSSESHEKSQEAKMSINFDVARLELLKSAIKNVNRGKQVATSIHIISKTKYLLSSKTYRLFYKK